jgi:2',3'-cyclic-nucleotide 2'-phosphodiesterase/3'-nucleotidase
VTRRFPLRPARDVRLPWGPPARARRYLPSIAALGLAVTIGCPGSNRAGSASGPPESACATILSTNDTHGRLLAATYGFSGERLVGGSAVLGGYLHDARTESSECPAFLVSAGDAMQGTLISNLTDGVSTIAVMNELGYDALAIGNHEFDWGVDVLRDRIEQSAFPFLGANIYERGTDEHPDWTQPYAILERGGVRVGVVGLTTRSTPTTTMPANVAELEFRSIADALDRYIPEVRAQGADFVVVVMHAGAFCDSAGVCHGEAMDELNATRERFDYAVTGHTHSRVETTIHGAPVVQSFANSTAFGIGRLRRDAEGNVEGELIEIRQTYADKIESDADITALVEQYRETAAAQMERVVATLAVPLDKPSRQGEFALGRVIADAQRDATGTQIAVMNNGGIRRSLPAGPVTYNDLFELQPFGNTLVVLDLPGELLIETLEHALDDEGPDAHLSGMTVMYDPAASRGRRVREARLASGDQIQPDRSYSVTANDFMATGGSGYRALMGATSATMTGIVDLEALVRYLEARPQPIQPPVMDRWQPIGR